MKKRLRIISLAIVALALFAIGYTAWEMHGQYAEEKAKVMELENRLATLSLQEKQSAVMQSVNAQMEEIANQQRIISDEQRDEAEQQSRIANEMRQHAEQERQNAQEAEKGFGGFRGCQRTACHCGE